MKFVLSNEVLTELATVLPDDDALRDCVSAARAIESVINEQPFDTDAPASRSLARAARILATATRLAEDLALRQERQERKRRARGRPSTSPSGDVPRPRKRSSCH